MGLIMATLLPPPPVDPVDPTLILVSSVDIVASIRGGLAGQCVICQMTTTRWWDLTTCGMLPVTDGAGTLTDQVGLHPSCASAVIERWVTMVAGPGDDEPPADTGADPSEDPAGGDSVTRADRPEELTRSRADRLALLGGVYGS